MKTTDSSSEGKRILIVDDSALMRRNLRTLLEAQDSWEVAGEAGDGLEAIAKTDEQEFDVILLDLQMPRMDGLQVAKHITSRWPDMPILMVSVHASQQLWNEARKVGIRGVCGKTDIKCVVEGIATILENKPYFGGMGLNAEAS
jgi:DNA-binding NarL/FixJ family response regulator